MLLNNDPSSILFYVVIGSLIVLALVRKGRKEEYYRKMGYLEVSVAKLGLEYISAD